MTRRARWQARLTETFVIVASILMAFSVDAWWEDSQAKARQRALLDNLSGELELNIRRLERAVEHGESRTERVNTLLREVGQDPVGLTADSLSVLQASLLSVYSFEPAIGVLNLLIQSGDLLLIENTELRTRLAGLPSLMGPLLENQKVANDYWLTAEALFNTESSLYDYSAFLPESRSLVDAPREPRDLATKILVLDVAMWPLIARQAGVLLQEVEEILEIIGKV